MLTFQLAYALSDKLLTIFERASQLGQRSHGDQEKALVRLNELQFRPLTYTIFFAYPYRNRNHTLARYSSNLTQIGNTIQTAVKPYN